MDNACLTVCNAGGPQAAACLGVVERPGLGGGHRQARSQAAGRAAAAAVPTELERHLRRPWSSSALRLGSTDCLHKRSKPV